jgi:hypothetical protein
MKMVQPTLTLSKPEERLVKKPVKSQKDLTGFYLGIIVIGIGEYVTITKTYQ